MHIKVISDRGLTRLFDGEVMRNFRRDGVLENYTVKPFRYEGKPQSVVEASRTLPNIRGVYRARAVVEELKAHRSSCFFPREWTRGDVLQAIEEAYAVRVPERFGRSSFCNGLSSTGIEIVLELDASGLVLDAIPQFGKQMSKRELSILKVEQGIVKSSPYVCAKCATQKQRQWICPRGHNIPQVRRTLYKRLRYQARRLWFGLGRAINGV
jgi:hypothetical protein